MSEWIGTEIAIVGMSGRFPGAENIEEFWDNLVHGRETVTFFTDEELLRAGVPESVVRHPDYVKARGVLRDVEAFDAGFFGYTPGEARIIDPQHRLFLECAWEALEDAGCTPDYRDGNIGVFAGCDVNSYLIHHLLPNEAVRGGIGGLQVQLANEKDYLATRVSYKLDLKGPSLTVQTACSTSLVAVHLACQSLINGECDLALAGGAGIILPQTSGQFYQEGGIISRDGHCRPFDAKAQGTIRGNGVACVALKRLSDALEEGDSIYAVIRGTSVNNDGAGKVGFTAPSRAGQERVIVEALVLADVDPETITYVEAHGTGTRVGDPIEVAALTQAFRLKTEKTNYCALGSVKANVGHLGAASGVTGLIKAALALKHRLIPPSPHFTEPNPLIDFRNSPFYVNNRLQEWRAGDQPRRAGVSSFGLGGTNAHAIVEEAPPQKRESGDGREYALLSLSAKSPRALALYKERLVRHLEKHPDTNLADAAYTLHRARKHFPFRDTFVCRDVPEAIRLLRASPDRMETALQAPAVVFMFPGQGTQYVNMGRELYEKEAVFRESVDRCARVLKRLMGKNPVEILYPSGDDRKAEELEHTDMIQACLFMVEYALAQLLIDWGIRPSAMIGHSFGEYVAACLAGVFSLEDALHIIVKRGQLMRSLPEGAMVAVFAPAGEILPHVDGRLSLALVNSPENCVISGPVEEVVGLEERLSSVGVVFRRVKTSHAIHSSMMNPILEEFVRFLETIPLHPPEIPYVSNVTGRWITAAEATDPQYWGRHLQNTVRFAEGLETLQEKEDLVLVEVGPGRSLNTFVRQCGLDGRVVSLLRHPAQPVSDDRYLLEAIGRLWASGVSPDWDRFYRRERRIRIQLPTYAFDRQRYWVDAPGVPETGGGPFQREAEKTEERPVGSHSDSEGVTVEAIEADVIRMWKELFGLDHVGQEDHFFELGGDSLLGVQMLTAVGERYRIRLPLSVLFEFPTAAAFAGAVYERLQEEEGEESAEEPPIQRVSRDGDLPASEAQERFWSIWKNEPFRHYQQNDVLVYRIRGKLDIPALEKSVNALLERHESFRTSFAEKDGRVVQRIHPPQRISLSQPVDLRPLTEKWLGWFGWSDGWWSPFRAWSRRLMFHRLNKRVEEAFARPFDLQKDSLLVRAALYRIGKEDYVLSMVVHRVTADGWSLHHMEKELLELYKAHSRGMMPSLGPVPFQHADYAAWQRAYFQGERLAKRLSHWERQLEGEPFDLALPRDFEETGRTEYRCEHHYFEASAELSEKLRIYASEQNVTMIVLLLAVFKTLLFRITRQEDFAIVVPIHNRTKPELEPVMGRLGVMVPLRTRFSNLDNQFRNLLDSVRRSLLEGTENILPFEILLKRKWPDRFGRYMPPYRVIFNFHNIPTVREEDLPEGLTMYPVDVLKNRLDADLTLVARPGENRVEFDLRYDPKRFSKETVQRMARRYLDLLEEAVEHRLIHLEEGEQS